MAFYVVVLCCTKSNIQALDGMGLDKGLFSIPGKLKKIFWLPSEKLMETKLSKMT